jgi:hypothetical protein
MKRSVLVLLTSLVVAAIVLFLACGGGGNSSGTRTTSPATASITTTISDPATCAAPQGPYSHIYVTIVDVKVSTNANAGDNDSSFIDLTPNLKTAPVQVDLLASSTTQNQCFLATLGSNQALTAGSYQQIRVFLADNATSTQPANNKCGKDANCVVLTSDPSTTHTLQLSSEAQTGIKIPSGQIGGGGVTATAGASQDLNIDFDACASVVLQGNGAFRLKPVLHAGEVSTTSSSISGSVIDKATNVAIVGGKTVVALEQKDSGNIDRVVMQTVADSTTGNFNFCPVPAGTYDVVVTAVNGAGVAYATTLTVGVQPGNALGKIQMIAQTGANTGPASLTGLATSAGTGGAVSVDVSVSALETIGTNLTITVPAATNAAQASATVSVATAATSSSLTCPAGTDCGKYTLTVPAVAPTTGTFAASGTIYTAGAGAATYIIEGHAFVPSSGGKDDCTPAVQTVPSITANAGQTTNVATNLAFVGCS